MAFVVLSFYMVILKLASYYYILKCFSKQGPDEF